MEGVPPKKKRETHRNEDRLKGRNSFPRVISLKIGGGVAEEGRYDPGRSKGKKRDQPLLGQPN